MVIRTATFGDSKAICDLYPILFAEAAKLQPMFWDVRVQSESFIQELIQKETAEIFVAQQGAVTVGFAAVTQQGTPPFPCIKPYRYAYLMDLFVLPMFRRKGIGTQLMNQVKLWARQRSLSYVELGVLEENARAIGLYERNAFKGVMRTMRCML